ncbi:MAG TPA: toll/interleukin-1 receptor domain-containing protein [Alloacidobacterium sp.]|nr:toll/interleukin-1 receptor domain-containing protein [Alloacidobacterium sp.]
MAHAIFISYRRDDSEGEAGRLFDDLSRAFGNDAVFMDVSGIEPGSDFRKAIDDGVASCGVLLAIIGPMWATITGSDGKRRLDNENDYVRLEIASALKRNIAVIPVLVHGAHMPHADQLPDDLQNLAYRNSVEITLARWNSDMQLLIQALAQYVHATKSTETATVHATVPVQLPALRGTAATEPARSKKPLWLGIGGLAVIAIAAVLIFALHGFGTTGNPLTGRWVNPAAAERGAIAELDISGNGSQLAVHAWSLCRPANCDLGTQTASFDGKTAKATWSMLQAAANGQEAGRVATLTMSSGGAGKLEVSIANTYAQRAGNTHRFEFVAAK